MGSVVVVRIRVEKEPGVYGFLSKEWGEETLENGKRESRSPEGEGLCMC
ncbi:centromere/kinetochore protein zw10-like protein [Corchorus olitorius]|uniref:Centromere/kinetochore protein zw10-like protein n=1 Tax=Corchorus olitorius TaxID=93759 RepID=A0A1R3KE27_9ROSI|nr:centromere/kinetochore protein zw10-like protein [Corchorus olitorius]